MERELLTKLVSEIFMAHHSLFEALRKQPNQHILSAAKKAKVYLECTDEATKTST